MAEMGMNKAIHGAFRRDLARFITALSSLAPGDAERGGRLAIAWSNFDDQLTQHHTGEHEIAWRARDRLAGARCRGGKSEPSGHDGRRTRLDGNRNR